MKKFINNNDDFLKESLTGFGKAHSDIINVNLDPSFISRKKIIFCGFISVRLLGSSVSLFISSFTKFSKKNASLFPFKK